MSRLSLVPINVQYLAAAPTTPTLQAGDMYYDSVLSGLYVYTGSSWVGVGGSVSYGTVTAQTTYGLSSGNGSATTVSRSDHTHGTPSLSTNTPAALGAASAGSGTTPSKDDHVHPTTGLGLTSGTLAQFAATTSSQLAGVISDETGSGSLVFGTGPTISNPIIDNPKLGYATTATAAGSTTLTATSGYQQFFTGTSTQTIVLPVASTMALGQGFVIVNNSTGNLTVNSSGGNLVVTVIPATSVHITCILTSGTTAASWDATFNEFDSNTGTGANVLAASPTLSGTPAAPTAAANTNTTQIATTAFVLGQGNATAGTITALGTQAAGSSNLYARADHVHPTTGIGLTSGTLAQFSATTSAQLAGVISDETGSGALVFGTGPTLSNPIIDNPKTGYATTATAAGTTTLTVTSGYWQFFTGTSTQTIVLPVASTMALGQGFTVVNNSTGNLTINSSGGNLVVTVIPQTSVRVSCILASGTTAASWDAEFSEFGSNTGTGANVLAASPTLSGTPAAPTAAANTNTTQIATTAFVLGQGNSTAGTIAALGTQAAGTSNLYARADHVHPTTGIPTDDPYTVSMMLGGM